MVEIVQLGAKVIRRKADLVPFPLNEDIKEIIETLTLAMREGNLVGIAAPQIGESVRLFLTEIRPDNSRGLEANPLRIFINPEITHFSAAKDVAYEGCGSVAEAKLFGQVERSVDIEMRSFCENGEPCVETFTGFLARVIQHEFDHLNGVVFTDKLYSFATLMSASEFRKLGKK